MVTATLLGCGDAPIAPSVPADTGQLITIVGLQFLPPSLNVVPGSSVQIRNEDPFLHTVTSEAVKDSYTPGAPPGMVPFDTGAFTGTRAISIPATVPVGTKVPYYCQLHGIAMPQGELVVVAP